MTLSYFAGRSHIEAMEHAAQVALRRRVVCYVGLVRASPWVGPDEPVRYARFVTCDLACWQINKSRVVHVRSVQPSEALALLTRCETLRNKRWDRRRKQKRA